MGKGGSLIRVRGMGKGRELSGAKRAEAELRVAHGKYTQAIKFQEKHRVDGSPEQLRLECVGLARAYHQLVASEAPWDWYASDRRRAYSFADRECRYVDDFERADYELTTSIDLLRGFLSAPLKESNEDSDLAPLGCGVFKWLRYATKDDIPGWAASYADLCERREILRRVKPVKERRDRIIACGLWACFAVVGLFLLWCR